MQIIEELTKLLLKGDGNLNKFQLRKIYSNPIAPYERVSLNRLIIV
ncbi:hypothetical protein RAMDARK_0911 [Rickettsia amblyommatis str. Darkwater]|nr:hypothetical protein RAMDARK_0911 [Rickettsia amblyommatis str. Darkwater]